MGARQTLVNVKHHVSPSNVITTNSPVEYGHASSGLNEVGCTTEPIIGSNAAGLSPGHGSIVNEHGYNQHSHEHGSV